MRTDVASVSHDREEVELKDRSDGTAIVNQATKDGILSNISELDGRHHESLEAQQDADLSKTLSTLADGADMRRMGKEQRLIRRFRPLSITSFTAIATASWELGIFVITPGLTDGGRAGLLWNAIWCFLGFAPIYLSMAEMASMAPIAGAQYHWVSEFAPESCQRSLSYFTGWVSTIAWQAGNCIGMFLAGSLIQTMILINNEDYAFPAWHGTLLAMATMAVAYTANVYGARALPYWQNAVFAIHVAAYFGYIVPIWTSGAPRASHAQVWTEFQNEGGWSSITLAILIGQLSGIGNQTGVDTAAHMSEEVKDASATIPKAIMATYLINFVLLFPTIVTICYHIPDVAASLEDPTTYPAIYVLRQSMSNASMTGLLALITLILLASNIVYLAAVSRDLFAFARDKGLPFSKWLSAIDKTIPVNASRFSSVVAVLMSTIYIGSPVAFYAITSLGTVSLVLCYTISIGCLLWRRITKPETLPPARFSLGNKVGIFVNSAAVLFGVWAAFWLFWPQTTPVTAAGFNWASVIFVSILVVATVYFFVKGRRTYFGPVVEVLGRKDHFT
ncbi:amino acid permease-16 [Elsinoe australis]|uniref:Amino acid permease-16 n=1 Tax=Elsinoe australis TaxID=40998 RepID=A0A4U7AL05_9PEZI|nr:amino acid permease-16 [Elsinoe australis]